jgi:protein-L-isoaspartate(D-aspartate) O-methyltransferase
MVQQQIVMRGIVDTQLLAAFRKIPREEFVPEPVRELSYTDSALPIGYEQTISQPYIVALMTKNLQLGPTDRVLEIGTGSGYQAAILSQMASQVFTIEIVEALGKRAQTTLQRLGYKNVQVKVGDGYRGWPEHAPYDAVIVTCAPERVPRALIEQTKEGGRIVIPVGPPNDQKLYLFGNKEGRLEQRMILPVRFVPMTGAAKSSPMP